MDNVERPTRVAHLDAGTVEYRLDRRGDATVAVFHGGHVRAGLAMGEDVFADAGYTVLVPSRPGYGRTPLSTGRSVEGFSDVTRALCEHLGIAKAAAVVGISGGGPTAVTMVGRHADLVERVILLSAVGWLRYPQRGVRIGAYLVFAPVTERATWAAVALLMRVAPDVGLRIFLSGLSTQPAKDVVTVLRHDDRAALRSLFMRMRSGRGFLNDLRPTPDATGAVGQPTLVIATRKDGGVPFAQSQSLVDTIRNADFIESRADSHFIWLGPDWPTIAARIRDFLDADAAPTSDPYTRDTRL